MVQKKGKSTRSIGRGGRKQKADCGISGVTFQNRRTIKGRNTGEQMRAFYHARKDLKEVTKKGTFTDSSRIGYLKSWVMLQRFLERVADKEKNVPLAFSS